MKVLLDTNVILDVLLRRSPHDKASLKVFSAVERGELDGFLCATTVTTIYYLLEKALGARTARKRVENLLSLFNVAPVTRPVLKEALTQKFQDYEDSVLYQSGLQAGAQAVLTRNVKDFRASTLPVHTPEEFVQDIEAARRERAVD